MAKSQKTPNVGRGKPPTHSQFKRGQSGNPKGRPKGTRNLKTDLAEELSESIPIRENGKTRRISKQRAMLKGAVACAIQGDQRALTNILSLAVKLLVDEIKDDIGSDMKAMHADVLAHFKNRVKAEVMTELGAGKNVNGGTHE